MTKYIFVTGGVVSGLGKGITASSIGTLLKHRGLKIFVQKFDPYLNVDPGTMSPYQHGEVFVTDDGAETDLDLGHYERFIDNGLSKLSSVSSGMIYQEILAKERAGEFLGETVQVVPHVTSAIKDKIKAATNEIKPDVQIIEIGGTIGDIESLPFIEAIREFSLEVGSENVIFIHTTLLPYLKMSKELKSKPTQHSVRRLMEYGIVPNFIVLRAEMEVPEEIKEKISRMCTIRKDHVIDAHDLDNIYKVPELLHSQNMDQIICDHFGFDTNINLEAWTNSIKKYDNLNKEITIAIAGKYIELEDAYISVKEAVCHAGLDFGAKTNIKWINTESVNENNVEDELKGVDGVIVPGGFGNRGIEGKIAVIKHIRENNIPFLGICLGMQLATIEFARNVAGLKEADSTEFNPNAKDPIIDYLPDQYEGIDMGGTMRLGLYDCSLIEGTLASKAYEEEEIKERHRHRYEFNNKYKKQLEEEGLIFSGINKKADLVEIIELPNHKHFIAGQFHPEFKSRPTKAHPLFVSLVKASLK